MRGMYPALNFHMLDENATDALAVGHFAGTRLSKATANVVSNRQEDLEIDW